MLRSFLMALSGLVVSWGLGGCYGTLKYYSPRTQVEAEVRQTLLGFEQAYNTHDSATLSQYLHRDPVLVAEAHGVFPVGEYTDGQVIQSLSQAMERFPQMRLGEPTIFITLDPGDRAVLEVLSGFGQEKLPTKFSMIREGDQWVIKKILYY